MTPETQNPQLLLESNWLHGLAHSLVRDRDQAEDLYQETMLAAIRRGRSIRGGFRPWLASVARRIASGTFRAESRIRRREQAAARPERDSSAAEVVQKFEIQRTVAEAISGLSESYRAALLLRFWEDLPPREIARRLELPVETVRTRIKRGLTQLRERLDTELGDRRTWASALIPIAKPLEEQTPWRRIAPWVGLPLVAASLALVFPPWGSREPTEQFQPLTRPVAWYYSFDISGERLAVPVGLRGIPLAEYPPNFGVTWPDGFGGIYRAVDERELEARSKGWTTVLTTRIGPTMDQKGTSVVVAAPTTTCVGIVRDQDGNPVPGAEVSFDVDPEVRARFAHIRKDLVVPTHKVLTTADGRFTLAGIGRGEGALLVVQGDGYRSETLPLPEQSSEPLSIALFPRH